MADDASSLNDTKRVQQLMAQNACVLLIEDDPLARERLELLIEAAGFGVLSVSSAQQAREALEAVLFPIVIIDRMLEDEDGITLCAQIRQLSKPNRVYAMLLSAKDSPEEIAAGLAAGADDYLSKQASDEELLAHLHKAIRMVRLQSR